MILFVNVDVLAPVFSFFNLSPLLKKKKVIKQNNEAIREKKKKRCRSAILRRDSEKDLNDLET